MVVSHCLLLLRTILSLYCKIFSWVRRSTLQLGAQGGEIKRERRGRSATKCTDRNLCFHLINQETQFYGCSPSERVNHVYLVVLCD